MNPLSPLTYYRRHRRHAALLLGLVGLATAGVYLAAALTWGIFVEPLRVNRRFLSRFSLVLPEAYEGEPDPAVAAQIRANPDVERVIPTLSLQIGLPEVMGGGGTRFELLALAQEDVAYVMERCGVHLREGRLPDPRTNGIALSWEVAANLGLQVGDTMHSADNPQLFGNLVDPFEVVGILEGDVRLGLLSYEFVRSHETYSGRSLDLLVTAREGREEAIEGFLEEQVRSGGTGVWTYRWLVALVAQEVRTMVSLAVPVVAVVSLVITLVVGAINRIALTRRLAEFGLLHAVGYGRRQLTRRVAAETAVLASAGSALGVALAWLALFVLRAFLFQPRGYDLGVVALTPSLLAAPVPLSVIGSIYAGLRRVFCRLDAVAIVERREASVEEDGQRPVDSSRARPLSSSTFYLRHRRRAALLVGAMALMTSAVVLVVLLFSAAGDAQRASLGYLARVSRVTTRYGAAVDPGALAPVRAHPAVERVIRFGPRYGMLSVLIPLFGDSANASPFSVYEQDLVYLVDLYGLELQEGSLPRPYTNEMVIANIVARNRGLEVGDVIGDPDHPAYPDASPLPAPFVVSGIFAPAEGNWLSFVSLEFIESHEAFDVNVTHSLMIVPRHGQKDVLDDWLENDLAGSDLWVMTQAKALAEARQETRSLIETIALIESVVAVVAALGLAVLNHIFVGQRRVEFGVLHALGRRRAWLVGRTVREAALTTGAAWCLCAVICLVALAYVQFGLFAPLGLVLDPLNPTPWLFSLPIPAAVLAAAAATTSRTLSRLDAVAIIERR
jgi:putative ABC transport system permease protein